MSSCDSPIIVALDFPSASAAEEMIERLDPKLCRLKVGKELFTREGPQIVRSIQSKGFDLFLDLKYHDIPYTTAMAVKAAAELGVWMVNVHCSGGVRMMEACRNELDRITGPKPLLIGVTVLTSMGEEDLQQVGLNVTPEQQVMRLAGLAAQSGMDGLVCSAQEATQLKQQYPQLQLVTPGIRPAGAEADDQRRILTPRQAMEGGSDYLVIGRPITQADDPSAVLTKIIQEIS